VRFELHTARLDPVLQSYIESRARVNIIRGPLGSGKTFGSCQKLFTLMTNQAPNRQGLRKSRWIAIRNTFPDLLTTTVKDWMELFGELGTYKAGGISPPSHSLKFRLADKSLVLAELIFIALDRPLAIKKLRGTQVTGFWLNEIKELDKSIIDMADFRHGRYPSIMDGGPTWHGILGDTNSPDDDHWLYEMAEEVKPTTWAFFDQPGGLMREMIEHDGVQEWTGKWIFNPAAENVHNLPSGKDYYVVGQEGKSQAWIAVNLANEYGSVYDGKAIYAEQWADDIHVASSIELIEDEPIIVGLDFGLMPAAIIGQETPNGTLHILEELVADGMGINQFATNILLPALRARYSKCEWFFIGDPAGNKRADTDEQTVFKELEDLDIYAEAANSNSPLVRWEAVRYFLQQMRGGKPAFRLHPRCKVLRKGFNGGYKLRRIQLAGATKFSEKAVKDKFSHPHDALQYLCMYVKGEVGESNNDFEREYDEAERWAR
jgi:hypothetical protein